MVLTPSSMVELGMKAPNFELPDFDEKVVSLDDFNNFHGLLIMFICNHCPFVKHVKEELGRLANDYQSRGITIIGINSNDVKNYPEDSPEKMKIFSEENNWSFHYLYDESQDVAKSYHGACTPDFFLFDQDKKLVYRGQLDDSRPDSGIPVTGKDLRLAIEALLNGNSVIAEQKPSMGCNIKWKD